MGVVLFVFLCGRLPFKGKDIPSLFDCILAGKYEIPDSLSSDCQDLIKSMLCLDTEKRISMEEIIRHPWLCKGDWTITECSSSVPTKIEIEQTIAAQLENLGFDLNQVINSLKNKEFNQSTATYNLLSRKRKSNGNDPTGVTRTKSEAILGKYVGGVVSMPTSLAPSLNPSPTCSREPSPTHSPTGNFLIKNPSPPKETLSLLQQRRLAHVQRMRGKGHKRTFSDHKAENCLPTQPPHTNSSNPNLEPVKRAKSVTVKPTPLLQQKAVSDFSPATAPCTSAPTVVSGFKPNENPCDISISITKDNVVSSSVSKEDTSSSSSISDATDSSWVMIAPSQQRQIGHRRYKSEDKLHQKLTEPRKREPATQPLWNSVEKEEEPCVRQLTEQDLLKWKATEESERQQITDNIDASRSFASIINWTKKMLSRRPVGGEQSHPREIRTSFSSSTTSRKHPKEIISEIKRVLDELQINFESNFPYCLKAYCPRKNIQFEVEVCVPPNLKDIYVIRLRRISGDWISYKDQCQAVMQNLNL